MKRISTSFSRFSIVVESMISRKTKKSQINEINNATLNKTGPKPILRNMDRIATK